MNRKIIHLLVAFSAATFIANTALPVHAGILTNVPMQGSMVMPILSYTAADGAMHVEVDPTIPDLTPLLVSNPSDSFDPSDPWSECLDPCRQGLAFSRRYGFVMGTTTDPLPPGTSIWIRKLSGPPELGAYRYRVSAPKTWEPIFGTAGSSNALMWNGMMFHPAFTVPPGTNSYSATFEAFLADTTTGAPVPDTSTGPFVLNWKSLPDGRPLLSIAQKFVVSWPVTGTNWVLEYADELSGSNWTQVTNVPVMLDGKPAVVLDDIGGNKHFRMRLVP